MSDWRVREGNPFPDGDSSLFKALYFSRGCFNDGCTHSSLLQRCSSTLRTFSSLFLHILLLLAKGSARRFETVITDGTVVHLRRLTGEPPLTMFSLCFLAAISLRLPWLDTIGVSLALPYLYHIACLRINQTA